MELKNRIINEASDLFFSNGVRSITMSDIAQHLGISKRTVYENFKDKEDLLAQCLDLSMKKADIEKKQVTEESSNVIEYLMKLHARQLQRVQNIDKKVLYDIKKYHPNLYKVIDQRQKDDLGIFVPLFEKGIEDGLIRDDLNSEILLWTLKSQLKSLIDGDFIPTQKFQLSEFMDSIVFIFLRGITTAKGNELIAELSPTKKRH
ncbi:TetR family transcriptional regulator [Bacteroidales bacterium]|nr:TetR family transcriptional regulator [Bacteroidales bacterium]